MTRSPRTLHKECGATFIEATFILPIIVLLFISTIVTGLGLSQHAMFTDGVRAASRAAVTTVGSCDHKREAAENFLTSFLEAQGLRFSDIAAEPAEVAQGGSAGGSFQKHGMKVKVRAKLMGMFSVDYQAVAGFEGGDSCDD